MKYFFVFLFCIPACVFSQKTIKLDASWEQVAVDNVPEKRLPKGAHSVMFVNSFEDTVSAFYFGFIVADKELKVLGKFTDGAEWLNLVKSAATYSNDTIELWSQQPFRATQTVYTFLWKKNKIVFLEAETTDPSSAAINFAEEALRQGNIREAIDYYYQVQYPMAYMDEDQVGFQLLSRANELAMDAANLKNFPLAVQTIETALEWWTLQSYMDAEGEMSLNQVFEDQYQTAYKDSFGLWMSNYGYFLYKADSLKKSIEINTKLNLTYPQLTEPYLHHADALYDMGEKIQAKKAYQDYYDLMMGQERMTEIPERVWDRSKGKAR